MLIVAYATIEQGRKERAESGDRRAHGLSDDLSRRGEKCLGVDLGSDRRIGERVLFQIELQMSIQLIERALHANARGQLSVVGRLGESFGYRVKVRGETGETGEVRARGGVVDDAGRGHAHKDHRVR